ncbi:hypothetical protein SRHO_G00137740 [Serrasalmus rhombeus]
MCRTCAVCLFFMLFAGKTNCVTFQQIPSLLAKDNVTITCSHDDSSLQMMYWYRQKSDSTAMTLIGFGYPTTEQTYEDDFKQRFKLNRQGATKGDLTISKLLQSDSAVYYCAASMHSAACT